MSKIKRKRCNVCRKKKSTSSFSRMSKAPDGRAYRCKICHRIQTVRRKGKPTGRPKLSYNVGRCKYVGGCKFPIHCRSLCTRHYRNLHYEEHERARRGAKKTPRLPIGTERDEGGYIRVKVSEKRDWRLKHHLVMEKHIGRRLRKEETVHHKNGQGTDNHFSNLELWASRHPKGQRVRDLIRFAKEILKLYGDKR